MYNNDHKTNNVFLLSKCGREKNPCKICFQPVTKRNGLQCQGACRKWVHFSCLGYTPGKIADIKAGHLTIVCPCPDCSTEPKEILTNPPVTCPEKNCPANNFPKCESKECPKNSCNASFSSTFPCECVNPLPPERAPSNSSSKKPPKPIPPQPAGGPRTCKEMAARQSKSCSCVSTGSTKDTSCKPAGCTCQNNNKPMCSKPVEQYHSLTEHQQCKASCSSDSQMRRRPGESTSMIDALEQMCVTVTNLSEQIKHIMGTFGQK